MRVIPDPSSDPHLGPMQRALDLAELSTGLASPNPQVGCVLTRNGVVLGEGAHHYDQRDHAEIVALKQAAAAGHSHARRHCLRHARALLAPRPYRPLRRRPHRRRHGPLLRRHRRPQSRRLRPRHRQAACGGRRGPPSPGRLTRASPRPRAQQRLRLVDHPAAVLSSPSRPAFPSTGASPHANASPATPHWLTAPRVPRRGPAHAPRFRRHPDRHRHRPRRRSTPHRPLPGLPRRRPLQRIVLDRRLRIPPRLKNWSPSSRTTSSSSPPHSPHGPISKPAVSPSSGCPMIAEAKRRLSWAKFPIFFATCMQPASSLSCSKPAPP